MQLLDRAGGSTVVVVGSGPAGVELATTVADKIGRKSNIQLISTGRIPCPSPIRPELEGKGFVDDCQTGAGPSDEGNKVIMRSGIC